MPNNLGTKAARPLSHWQLVGDHCRITPQVTGHRYDGAGTDGDPYVITWLENDPGNPMEFSVLTKWLLSSLVAGAMLATTFTSSAFTGGIREIVEEFDVSIEVATLVVSLFVLGFAVGPLIWAPLSEAYGRQIVFGLTYGAFVAINIGSIGSQNIQTLLVLRLLAGAFGSAPLTNAGGQIADMFDASERGLAMGLFALAPFLGPILGPIAGGFLSQAKGWAWVQGLMAIFSGTMWLLNLFLVPETYGPVLLRKRARNLSSTNRKTYRAKSDIQVPSRRPLSAVLVRPWVLLFTEPIVFVLSVYMAIIYGTLYMLFGAFPICFQEARGWSEGIGGLAFLGVAVGMICAIALVPFGNRRYTRAAVYYSGTAPPELRLKSAMVGAAAVPTGLFWFAWTNYPSIHWISSVMAGAPFGFGMVVIFLAVTSYLIDAYTTFAASALAANAVLRSLFGFLFPLFTRYMYQRLGIHWASSVPAFLALACVPAPFVLYKHGAAIRQRSHYADCTGQLQEEVVA